MILIWPSPLYRRDVPRRNPLTPALAWVFAGIMTLTATGSRAEATTTDPQVLYGPQVDYSIFRNGTRVGEHHLRFQRDGDDLVVDIESSLTVTVLRIPVYRFRYTAEERWQQERLVAVSASTRENSDLSEVSMTTDGSVSTLVDAAGQRSEVPALSFASNHWHRAVLESDRVFNTLTGAADAVTVSDLGTVAFAGVDGPRDARQFRYSGAIEADVWYDDQGRWLGLEFQAPDDSLIRYRADF